MNFNIFGWMILLILILVSCQPVSPKYLELTSPQTDIMSNNEPYQLKYFVINPTANTFIGDIDYEFDEQCLQIWNNQNTDIQVTPQEYRRAIIQQIQFRSNANRDNCIQRPLKVTISIQDAGGDVKDSFDISLTVTG